MKALFDSCSYATSKLMTRAYSTSFSLGIYLLDKRFHDPIYAIYGFVRAADEIVDTFHDFDKEKLLLDFRKDTYKALEDGISLNPILNAFQATVHRYQIDYKLIETFLKSMEMDLHHTEYDKDEIDEYILGSAEVVGLMCLKVFSEGDDQKYQSLVQPAKALGSAFQKVNFLRDLQADFESLGRTYFPGVDLKSLSVEEKNKIELDIKKEFDYAYKEGIKNLPAGSKLGVYTAYVYYTALLKKIMRTRPEHIMKSRIRVANHHKLVLTLSCCVRYNFI